jgi:predicted DNA binding protein
MKTIKQIADELGVSKQAVYKRSKGRLKEQLMPYTHTVDGVVHIDEQGESLIKSDFTEKRTYKGAHTEAHTGAHTNDKLYTILQAELDAKNRQIEDLTKQLNEERKYSREQSQQLVILADTAQKLHAGTIQQQLTTSEAFVDEPTMESLKAEKQRQEKRGLFGLFNKKTSN